MDEARSRVLGGFVEGIVSVFLFFPFGWSMKQALLSVRLCN